MFKIICASLQMFKEFIYAQRNLQQLGCWNCLEKLAKMFLNSFHQVKILVKNDREKIVLKALQLEFSGLSVLIDITTRCDVM